ncbi:MAG: hypothetical protein QM756_33555 [Polyangiaceae bacterium]
MVDRPSGERLPLLLKPFTASDLKAAVGRALGRDLAEPPSRAAQG